MSFFGNWEKHFDEEFINYIESRCKCDNAGMLLSDYRWEEFYLENSTNKIYQEINGEKVFFEYRYDIRRLQHVEEKIIQKYGSMKDAIKQAKEEHIRLLKGINAGELLVPAKDGEEDEIN